MKTKPKVLVLKADGTNCDEELAFAFKLAGGAPKIVHINDLRTKKEKLKEYNILAIPGGFSYGDDIVSGKILAVELTSFFSEELKKFIERKNTLTIGICNGFQVLVRTGILPFDTIGKMQATLTNNDSGHFECRWINLKIEPNSKCAFFNNETMKQFNNDYISLQVAHGEGKFFADNITINAIEKSNLVVLRYVDAEGKPTQNYPDNPNGSLNAIAGITDNSGRVLGLMPHPERFIFREQHPNWRRSQNLKPQGLPIFENMIKYIRSKKYE
ncbi:MAG: phosphoribosylformylglycinamidine synthase I [Candidatus Levybacteria bacterium]|nr:phosphoribosylformylglycinamidine synthase I [Candidatus Levybacteria bacterium]